MIGLGLGRSSTCSVQQSFKTPGQLLFLPKSITLPTRSWQIAASTSASNTQLLNWSFDETEQQVSSQQGLCADKQQQQTQTPSIKRQAQPRRQAKHTPQPAREQLNGYDPAQRTQRKDAQLQQHSSKQPNRQHAGRTAAKAQSTARYSANTKRHRQTEADEYAAAQQRVRELLISADVANPLATADAIPDTVNDTVIALNLLATAPKPSTMMEIKQYEMARQQLTAAVVDKFKLLLLNQQQQQQGALGGRSSHQSKQQQQQVMAAATADNLTTALADLPPTKLAAVTFSLGVLRHYDPDLIPALESASAQIMQDMLPPPAAAAAGGRQPPSCIGSSGSSGMQGLSPQQDHQQQNARSGGQHTTNARQMHSNSSGNAHTGSAPNRRQFGTNPGFNANQLGQLGQGFVYLDHNLSSSWHPLYLAACKDQLRYMRPQQLSSVAVFLVHYRGYSSSSISSGVASSSNGLSSNSSSGCWDLGAAWVTDFLAAAAAVAAAAGAKDGVLKPSQLVPVLQAAAGMYSEWRQQQQQQSLDQDHQQQLWQRVFGDLPVPMPAAAAGGGVPGGGNSTSSGSSRKLTGSSISSSKDWLLPLLQAFQLLLPDMKMNNLATVLPALAVVTQAPWPNDALLPLLLQVRLLLPAAAAPEAVAVAAAVVQLGAGQDIRSDQQWCDAYLHRIHALMQTLGPSDLATTARTLGQLHLKPYKAWLYEFCSRLRVETKNMNHQEVVMTLEGLSKIRLKLDPEVLHLFVLGIKRYIGFMSVDAMKCVIQALDDMYRRPRGRTILPGRTVQLLVEEMQRRVQLSAMQEGLPM